MRLVRFLTQLSGAALILAAFQGSAGQPWERTLQDGSQVSVDPSTGRASVTTPRGADTMLWDGVHKLEDGSTIIVRDGVVVPDVPMADARRGVPTPAARDTASPCSVLQRTTCGLGGECAQTEACRLAKQLLQFETEETPGSLSPTTAQCREALGQKESFPPCQARPALGPSSACAELEEKACGPTRQCADSVGCGAARQLVKMEHEERLTAANPEVPTHSTRQCQEAATDEFFASCTQAAASGTAAPAAQHQPAPAR